MEPWGRVDRLDTSAEKEEITELGRQTFEPLESTSRTSYSDMSVSVHMRGAGQEEHGDCSSSPRHLPCKLVRHLLSCCHSDTLAMETLARLLRNRTNEKVWTRQRREGMAVTKKGRHDRARNTVVVRHRRRKSEIILVLVSPRERLLPGTARCFLPRYLLPWAGFSFCDQQYIVTCGYGSRAFWQGRCQYTACKKRRAPSNEPHYRNKGSAV
ncbi:hypothetical protein V8F33_001958 [Rhypophila sp. PSN 637]